MSLGYQTEQPTRDQVDSLDGMTVLQFGANWCGYCRAAEAVVEPALADVPGLRRLKVEDGKGRPLGRSFRVTLWPTLIFLRDGEEVARVVRPVAHDVIDAALEALVDEPR